MNHDPYKYFRLEARELLTQLNAALLDLERNGNRGEQIQRLLRLAHTLKGAARVVKLVDIGDRAHAVEDVLTPFRDSRQDVPAEAIEAVLKHFDGIAAAIPGEARVADVSAEASASALPAAGGGEDRLRTVRADIAEMDELLEGVGAVHAILSGMRTSSARLDRAQNLAALISAQLLTGQGQGQIQGKGQIQGQSGAAAARAHAMAEELRKLLGGVKGSIDLALDQMNREIEQLGDTAEQLRLVPADTIFAPLERLARDVARDMDKHVAFEAAGTSVHLDGYILEAVRNALVQIVRNAVAHGIEAPEERQRACKARSGRVSLSVSRREKQVVFRCADDGRGIDLEAVSRAAEARGLVPAGRTASTEDIIGLLLKGGISTAGSVTLASGRGVGLDVVREAIGQLGGTITVETAAGKGATFELRVPISVTSLEALAVDAAGETVLVPSESIAVALRVAAEQISWTPQGASISHDGKALPFVSLSRALFGARTPGRSAWNVLILRAGERMAAVGVDRVIGIARAAMRPLADTVPIDKVIAGVTLDVEGNPQLVADPAQLVAIAWQGLEEQAEPAPASMPILVIDDSLTTRMLEQSILEAAGYDVDTATSGEEGFACAQSKPHALILVDVEMPGMDGFTFVERIRSDRALHDVPVILVSSRAAPEDLQRGRDVGADGYVIKGEFDQSKLLAMIKRLTAGR